MMIGTPRFSLPGHIEAAAEDWCRRLSRTHFLKRYWYLKPVAKAGLIFIAVIRRLTSRLSGPA